MDKKRSKGGRRRVVVDKHHPEGVFSNSAVRELREKERAKKRAKGKWKRFFRFTTLHEERTHEFGRADT